MAIKVKTRSKDVERWLDEHKVTWAWKSDYPIDDIDIDASLANQARLHEPVNKATVEAYAAAMERGDEFPGIVLVSQGDAYLGVVADGNHRLMAAREAGASTVGAYVVRGEPSSARMITLTMEANARHGQPTNLAERIEQAVWLVAQGAPQARAAASCNVPASQLKARLNRDKAEARGLEAGVKPAQWNQLSRAVRSKLAQISTDEGLKAAASLAYSANLTAAQASELTSLANATRSGSKQVTAVKAYADSVADQIEGSAGGVLTGKSSTKTRYAMAIGNIMTLPDTLTSATLKAWAPNERKKAAKQAREAARKLEALAGALEK